MRSVQTLDLKEAVITMEKVDEDHFAIIDGKTIYRKYSFGTFERESGFRCNLGEQEAYTHKCAIDTSLRGGILVYEEVSKNVFYFGKNRKKSKYSIRAHKAPLETLCFSHDGRYFLTGGEEGRVYFFDANNGHKVDIFPHHSDSISAVDISEDGRWIASASFDRIIKVTNRSFRSDPYKLISHKSVPVKLKFLSKQRILSADREGSLLVWDIAKARVIQRLESFRAEISDFVLSDDEKYLFVCGTKGVVHLYDLQTYELLKKKFIKVFSGITTALYASKYNLLLLGQSDGNIDIFDLQADERRFEDLLASRDHKACYDLCIENPMLYNSDAYLRLETFYENAFEEAKYLLEEEKTDEAKEVMKVYLQVVQKRLIVQKLFNDFSLYSQFKVSYQNKKYAASYALADEYDSLKTTQEYHNMEALWHKTVIAVQALINDKEYEKKMRVLFKPFQGVAGKNLIIHSLAEDRHVFSLFINAIEKKEYAAAFNIVENHPALKDMPEYKKLIETGAMYEENVLESFNSGDYYSAAKFCDQVTVFPGKANFANEIREKANIYAETMQYYAAKLMNKVYDMIKKYPYLEDAQIAKELENNYLEALRKSDFFQRKGSVIGVKHLMEPFFNVESKRDSILHIIAKTYITQLTFYLKKKDLKSLKKGLNNYRGIFGVNSPLEDFVYKYKKYYHFDFKVTEESRTYNASIKNLRDVIADDRA